MYNSGCLWVPPIYLKLIWQEYFSRNINKIVTFIGKRKFKTYQLSYLDRVLHICRPTHDDVRKLFKDFVLPSPLATFA